MVYDASQSGLNACLWVPSFALPTVEALTRVMDEHSWMGDIDLTDMFLNFPLDPKLRPFCGIDLKPFIEGIRSWECWIWCMMGLRSSPYAAIRALLFAFEVMLGNRLDPNNVYLPRHVDVRR